MKGLGRLGRDVAVYGVGTAVASAFVLLTVPVYTRVLAPAEYGQLVMVNSVMGIVAAVVILGGDTALARFWFQLVDQRSRWRMTATWILSLVLFAVAACLVLAPLAPWMAGWTLGGSSNASLYWLALIAIPIAQASRLVNQLLRNQYRPWPSAWTSIGLGSITFALGAAAAALLDLGVPGILLAVIVAEALVLLMRLLLTRQVFSVGGDRSLLRAMLAFAVPLVPVSLSFWVLTTANRVVLGAVSGLDELAIFGVATTVAAGFVVVTGAVSQAWVPRAYGLYETDRVGASEAIGRFLTVYVLLLGGLAVVLGALAPEIVGLLAAPSFADAAGLIPVVSLGAVAFGAQLVTSAGLTLTRRTRTLATLSVVSAVVGVLLSLLLIPLAGAWGASIAGALGFILLAVVYFIASQRSWKITVDWLAFGSAAILLIVALTATELLMNASVAARMVPIAGYAGLGLVIARRVSLFVRRR